MQSITLTQTAGFNTDVQHYDVVTLKGGNKNEYNGREWGLQSTVKKAQEIRDWWRPEFRFIRPRKMKTNIHSDTGGRIVTATGRPRDEEKK